MLDLSNVTLNSFLAVTVQDNTEVEPIPLVVDEQQQDDDLADSGDFVLLFTEAASTLPKPEEYEVQPETTMKEYPVLESQQKSPETQCLENNVAVAWIDSEYYQSEMNVESASMQYVSATEYKESGDRVDNIIETEGHNNLSGSMAPADLRKVAEHQQPAQLPSAAPGLHTLEFDEAQHDQLMVALPLGMRAITPIALTDVNTPLTQISLDTELTKAGESIAVEMGVSEYLSRNKIIETNPEDTEFLVQPARNLLEKVTPSIAVDESAPQDVSLRDEHNLVTDIAPISSEHQEFMAGPALVQDTGTASAPIEQPQINIPTQFALDARSDTTLAVPQSLNIPVELEDAQWSTQFSEHVVWLSQQGMKSAVIKIHPEDLGPLEISIKVDNDTASINIISHSQQVRDIIDNSLPRLQEMMAEQGLSLSDVQIDSDKEQRQYEQAHDEQMYELSPVDDEEEIKPLSVKNKATHQGVIDYFA